MASSLATEIDLPLQGKVYGDRVHVTVLHVEDCPNVAQLLKCLHQVLRGTPTTLTARVVTSPAEAMELGMHGSPTLLVNGRDPFAGTPEASLSCRLYPTDDGLRGRPTVAQLRSMLTNANVGRQPGLTPGALST
jgi:hypothetical protein